MFNLKSISFMSENSTSNVDNDECYIKNKEIDYKNLINRLKEIKAKIALLEKTIFK